jgi:hypothetical protein
MRKNRISVVANESSPSGPWASDALLRGTAAGAVHPAYAIISGPVTICSAASRRKRLKLGGGSAREFLATYSLYGSVKTDDHQR